jgi:hypothetical protein
MRSNTRKFYLVSLGAALLIAAIAFICFHFPGADVVSFYLDSNVYSTRFGVTVHSILNILMIGDLIFVWLVSLMNALIIVDTGHTTTIRKK